MPRSVTKGADARSGKRADYVRPAGATTDVFFSARSYHAHLAAAFVAGAALRLAFINTQILLDDEWHALDYAIGHDLPFLLTHFSVPGATCIPLNVYTSLLLGAGLWNETLLRLPALVAGITALAALPWLVGKALSRSVAVLFAWLLAISPFLVSYSRIARPYGVVTLAAGAASLCGYLWLVSGRRDLGGLYLAAGVVAVYFHLFAAVSLAVPLATGMVFRLLPSGLRPDKERIRPSYGHFAAVTGIFAVASSVLLGPALLNAAGGTASSVAGAGGMTAETAVHFGSMLAGTSHGELAIVFWGLLIAGFAVLSRQKPLLAAVVGSTGILYVLAMLVSRPQLIESSLVLSRYMIGFFPLALLLVACGMVNTRRLLARQSAPARGVRALGVGITMLFVAALFALGPIAPNYYHPNDFTAHSAFLESYAPLDWSRSYRSDMAADMPVVKGPAALSPFYHRLAGDGTSDAIIEFPMFVGNHFNLYYYYQHFHGKRVLAGFFPHFALQHVRSKGWVSGNDYLDYVMSRQHDPENLRMANMVDVTSPDAIRRSGADYIILHRHLMTEMSPELVREPEPDYAPVAPLIELYEREFGRYAFEDGNIIAFRVGVPR